MKNKTIIKVYQDKRSTLKINKQLKKLNLCNNKYFYKTLQTNLAGATPKIGNKNNGKRDVIAKGSTSKVQ